MAKAVTKKAAVRTRRRERKNIERGAAHIQSTFNNTIVTITDTNEAEALEKALSVTPLAYSSAPAGSWSGS